MPTGLVITRKGFHMVGRYWIVAKGTPFLGFTFHGPFLSQDRAEEWAMENSDDGFWWIDVVTCPNAEATT